MNNLIKTYFSKPKSLVIIIIPIYKAFHNLDNDELIALTQCKKVLYKHPVAFIAPKKLEVSDYLEFYKNTFPALNVHFFEDQYFSSVAGYNLLCLSPFFYDTFKEYRFMLIYQLDAFVFKDELDYWCKQNFDYIGSPWIDNTCMEPFYGIHAPIYSFNHWFKLHAGGNGGFSLRKISSHRLVLYFFHKKLYKINGDLKSKKIGLYEDHFWTMYLHHYYPLFSVAPAEKAIRFGYDFHQKTYQLGEDLDLPFGCHGWPHYRKDWSPYFESLGYNIL